MSGKAMFPLAFLAALLGLVSGGTASDAVGRPQPIRLGLARGFGDRGTVLTSIREGVPRAAVMDEGGRIVLGGRSVYEGGVLIRYLRNGALDGDFGLDGVAGHQEAPGEAISGLAIDPRGRLVATIGFQEKISVARFLSNGRLDRSFASGGFTSVQIPPEVGQMGGGDRSKASSISIDEHGRIVVSRVKTARTAGRNGTGFVLVRFNGDGSLDQTFGNGGFFTAHLAHAVPFQLTSAEADRGGGVTIVGTTFTPLRGAAAKDLKRFEIVRLRSDGRLDTRFGGGDGIARVSVGRFGTAAQVAALDSRDRIVLGGQLGHGFGFARLRPNGALDGDFGTGGKLTVGLPPRLATTDLRVIAIDRKGRVVVSGRATPPGLHNDYFLALRLRSSGELDGSFGRGGLCAASFPHRQAFPTTLALAADGDAIVSGVAELPTPGQYPPTASRAPAFALARCAG